MSSTDFTHDSRGHTPAESHDSWTDLAESTHGAHTPHGFDDVNTPEQHATVEPDTYDFCSFTRVPSHKAASEADLVSSQSNLSTPLSTIMSKRKRQQKQRQQQQLAVALVVPRAPRFDLAAAAAARVNYERLLRTMVQNGDMPKSSARLVTAQSRNLAATAQPVQRGALSCRPTSAAGQRMPVSLALQQEFQALVLHRHSKALRPRHGADPAMKYANQRHNAQQHHHYGHHTEMRHTKHPHTSFDAKSMTAFARERKR